MITDKTLDEAIVEALRFVKAAKALRAKRKEYASIKTCARMACSRANYAEAKTCEGCGGLDFYQALRDDVREHAACKRASLDLTRKLADLRAGR